MIKLGIVGFGVVGKSALSFLSRYRGDARLAELLGDVHYAIVIWDQRNLEHHEQEMLQAYGAQFIHESETSLDDFIFSCDKVLSSPGVDLQSVTYPHKKIVCELDFFGLFFKKPVIAITGSLGKTTTTIVFAKVLERLSAIMSTNTIFAKPHDHESLRVAVGGNIGTGMLDLAMQSDNFDCAVLELSSWQLERSKRFAPDIAVWTNLYPNHLDRHGTMLEYARAKYALIAQQTEQQYAVIPFDLLTGEVGQEICSWLDQSFVHIIVTSTDHITIDTVHQYVKNCIATVFIQDQDIIFDVFENNCLKQRMKLAQTSELLAVTFIENWLHIIGALYASYQSPDNLIRFLPDVVSEVLDNPYTKHRVEYFATVRDVDFYNDSKSTVIQATQAAVRKLSMQGRPIIIILGGLDKGVDRSALMTFLVNTRSIKKIYSFGKARDLVPSTYFSTLDEVVQDIMTVMQPHDVVLLSPSGASYDLFKNYQQRGDVFKELVLRYSDSV